MATARTRIDRFVEEALGDFSQWYTGEGSGWLGKERDCVNIFALHFLARKIQPGAAIESLAQIRIEGGVPQPEGYGRAAATKDLVIWGHPLATAWDEAWNPTHVPRVVMEWKTHRSGRYQEAFHPHDVEWLTRFTYEFPARCVIW